MLSLALGALLACWEGSLFGDLRLVVRVCCAAMVVCAIGGILVKTHPASRWDEFGRLVSFAALSFGAVTGCIAIDKGKSAIAGFLRTRALAAIGRISYGLYLYHLPIFVLLGVNAGLNLRSHAAPTLTHLAIAYILTFAAAGLSYRFIESPLLSLNRHSTAPKPSASYILGMRVDPTSYDNASRAIFDWAREKSSRYVCVANVYNVMTAHDCDEFRRATNGADLVTPDGMPLVWCLRAVGHSRAGRVYGPDLTAALIVRAASSGFSVGFYGSTPETIQLLQLAIQSRYPELKIAYAFSPPFRPLTPPEDEKVVREINRSGVDILFVGLGTPRQDYWMAAHKGRIQSVMVGVGAAFDFLAGTKAQAPRWMMSIGMEWFFRLISEPRRLAKRYLKQNPRFIALFALEMVAAKFGRAKSAKSTA
jgi:N-acetylglucosaminyldiphosphoundecaprenol N-acetyl-beta-D-mannosaminyltransferase